MARATFKTLIPDDQLKDDFDRISSTPVYWVMKAQDLLKASQVLETQDRHFDQLKTGGPPSEEKHNLFSVILMLRGMAIEALLKGLLTKQGSITSKDGELQLPPRYTNHRLGNMAEDVKGLDLQKDEYITLHTLSTQIFLGRLPAKKAFTGAEMDQVGWTAPHDEEVFHKVVDKITSMY